ncbi:HAAS signaling domain-containing protein [Glutamicibacter sp. NPDC087344]|uniref:HAAS signaling domain-containing protein n=1 Tax=Glutamicibacter sp. NPDC087344 TaxID=3363994 RepID=UPI00381280BD
MQPHRPRAARNYLEQLRRELSFLSDAERSEIIAHTAEQIAGLPGKGRRKSELLKSLGEPAALAAGFTRTEPTELKVNSGRQFLSRILAWPIFALSVLTAGLLVIGSQAVVLVEPVSFGYVEGSIFGMWAELELHMGSAVMLLVFIPVLFSLLPLITHGTFGLVLQVIGAVATTIACVLGLISLGAFLIPLVLLLWAQVFTPLLMMRGSMASPGPTWLICAAVVLLCAIGYTTYRGVHNFSGNVWLILIPALVLAVFALLLPLRRRWAHISLIVAGLAVMVAGYVAALPSTFATPLIWPWLAGTVSFAIGHLALAAGMWHKRAQNLLALL